MVAQRRLHGVSHMERLSLPADLEATADTRGSTIAMTSVDPSPVTLINVFEVPPERTDAFVGPWRERAALLVTKPGFLGGRLYRALAPQSRFQFVNVSQWATSEAWRAATADPAFQERISAVTADPMTRVSGNPGLYEVAVELEVPTAGSVPEGLG